MTETEWVEKLKQEGYREVMVCVNQPNTYFPEHKHEQTTVHVILAGSLILTEKTGVKTILPGERFEIPAGTTHTAKCGPDGCTFVVGVK